jgi:hypothetical protein
VTDVIVSAVAGVAIAKPGIALGVTPIAIAKPGVCDPPAFPWIKNLSFEVAGMSPGDAAAWTWTRHVSFRFAAYASAGGVSRFEAFELGWRADPFVGDLVAPTNARQLLFGEFGPAPNRTETFERQWRLPQPTVLSTDPGNETALFVWDAGSTAIFGGIGGDAFEPFEEGWHSNDTYLWDFGPLQPALYGGAPAESFEHGWKSNDTYALTFGIGALDPFVFTAWASEFLFEDFSAVLPDQPVLFHPFALITAPAPAVPTLPGISPTYPIDVQATFYNAGGTGVLPPEVDSRRTYYLLLPLSGPVGQFQISPSMAGGPIVFTGGSGNNFYKADTSRFWTLTDVGI